MPDRFVRLKIFAAKFFTVTPRRLITLLLSLIITVALNSPAVAAGPLRVNPVNSRYFFDADGAPVFLAGSYQNPYNLLNGDSWDLASYFDYLAQHNHNFTRLWAWEQSPWMFDSNGQVTYSLQPFERTGSGLALDGGAKFDLARFNQAYFDQLRARVIQAGQRGIYVSVILFEGFSSQRRVREVNPWLADPFQRDNNINGINADPNGNGRGEEFFSLNYPSLTALQEAFVRKIVDTLNDLDNVLYEISGDTLATSLLWQYHMIDYLKQYQSSKANQHPVGISQFYARKYAEVINSRADWIVTEGTNFNPPLVNSNKVVFNEGHPSLFTYSNPDQWVWRAFTRGYNLIYPEVVSDDAEVSEKVHGAISQVRAYSQLLDLSTMFPSTTLCSKGFCLGSQGSDYLVYLPSAGQVSIDLSAATVNLLTAWFDPVTGQTVSGDSASGGKRTTFTSPIRGQSVLQISPEQPASSQASSVSLNTPSTSTTLDLAESSSASEEMVATPKITPNGGIYSGSVRVSLSTKTPKATIHYTTDGKSPTQSSKKYTGAFTLTGSILVKAKAFKNGKNPSAEGSAWFADIGNATSAFNFTLANSGDKSVSAGSSTATTITATLASASSQTVSFTISGLPSGATAAFSSVSCTPTCSSTLAVSTSGLTPAGNYLVSVSASGGGQTRTTSFNLSVAATVAGTVATPTITPNGGSFASSVSVTMATATSGASIYYTTNGSNPTHSSTLYTGALTLTSSAPVKAKAFKSGYNSSAEASTSFNITLLNPPTFGRPQNYDNFVDVTKYGSLAAAIAAEDYIYIPQGNHLVDNPIIINRTTSLYLHGQGAMISRITPRNPNAPLFIVKDATHISIAGLSTYGFSNTQNFTAFRFENVKPVVFEMQNATYAKSVFDIRGPGTFTFQCVVPLSEGVVAVPLIVDHPQAELYFIAGNIAQGNAAFPGKENFHVWVKRGHLEIYGTGFQAAGGKADIRIDAPSPKGAHVIANIRSEGSNVAGNLFPSQLLYVPTTAEAVNVLIKASGLSGFGTIANNIEFIDYNGAGTVWLMGCNTGDSLTKWVVGNAPLSTIVALGNTTSSKAINSGTISTVNGRNIVVGNIANKVIVNPTIVLSDFTNVPSVPDFKTIPLLDRPRVTRPLPGMRSVMEFGAVGDGIADDTVALQTAINHAGYKLYFPEGTYRITRPLGFNHRTYGGMQSVELGGWMAGAGANLTKIVRDKGSVFLTESIAYFAIQGITFETDPYGAEVNFGYDWPTGFRFSSQMVQFTDVHFSGGLYGIGIGVNSTQQCDGNLLVNSRFSKAQVGLAIGSYNALANIVHGAVFEDNHIAMANRGNVGGKWAVFSARISGTRDYDMEPISSADGSTSFFHGIKTDTAKLYATVCTGALQDMFFENSEFTSINPLDPFAEHGSGAGVIFLHSKIAQGKVMVRRCISENYGFSLHSEITHWDPAAQAHGTSRMYELK